MTDLKEQLIRLGHQRPELRDDLRPVLDVLDRKASQKRANIGMRTTLRGHINQFLRVVSQKTLQWLQNTGAVTGGEAMSDKSFVVTLQDKGDVRVKLMYQDETGILATFTPDGGSVEEKLYPGYLSLEDLRFEIAQDTYRIVGLKF